MAFKKKTVEVEAAAWTYIMCLPFQPLKPIKVSWGVNEAGLEFKGSQGKGGRMMQESG